MILFTKYLNMSERKVIYIYIYIPNSKIKRKLYSSFIMIFRFNTLKTNSNKWLLMLENDYHYSFNSEWWRLKVALEFRNLHSNWPSQNDIDRLDIKTTFHFFRLIIVMQITSELQYFQKMYTDLYMSSHAINHMNAMNFIVFQITIHKLKSNVCFN